MATETSDGDADDRPPATPRPEPALRRRPGSREEQPAANRLPMIGAPATALGDRSSSSIGASSKNRSTTTRITRPEPSSRSRRVRVRRKPAPKAYAAATAASTAAVSNIASTRG